MRRLLLAALLVTGCGEGAAGPDGAPGGAAAPCTVTHGADAWTVTCPDGTSATVPVAGCTETLHEDGARTIRCDDGSEATILPSEELVGTSAVVGKVVGALGEPIAGAVVAIEGLDLQVESGGDGSFHLDDVPPGIWTLRASLSPYVDVRLESLPLLPGRHDAGTLQLRLGRLIPGEPLLLPWGYATVAGGEDGEQVVLYEYATDRQIVVEYAVIDARIDDTGIILWVECEEDRTCVGAWTQGAEEIHWHPDVEDAVVRPGGAMLGTRPQEDGSLHLVFLRGEVDLDLGHGYDLLGPLGDRPAWLLYDRAEGALHLLDGAQEAPSVERLDERSIAGDVAVCDAGLLVVAELTGATVLFDLEAGTSISIELAGPPVLGSGRMLWVEGSEFHLLEAGGTVRTVAGGEARPSPSWQAITYRDGAGAWTLDSWTGGEAMPLPAWPLDWAPGERRLILRDDDGEVLIFDRDTSTTTPSVPSTRAWWVGDEMVLVEEGREWRLLHVDGAVEHVSWWGDADVTLAGDTLLLQNEDETLVIRGRSVRYWLDVYARPALSGDGVHLAWLGEEGMLEVIDLERRETRLVASRVEDLAVFGEQLLWLSEDILGGRHIFWMPFR